MKIRPLPLPLRFVLCEGLVWDHRSKRLLMTDIRASQVFSIDLSNYTFEDWKMPEEVGWILPTQDRHRYALGLASGVAVFDMRIPGRLDWLDRQFPGDPDIRLNDACTDPAGRIWYGSMNRDDDTRVDGKLASYDRCEGVRIHDSGFSVTNGPLIDGHATQLYLNDSLSGVIYRYRLSLDEGIVGAREVFARFSTADGLPDGMCFDDRGNLWVAMWGGAKVIKLDTDGNRLLDIEIPSPNVTNLCFCGEDLKRLIVSTAATHNDAGEVVAPGLLYEVMGHDSVGTAIPFCQTERQ